MGNIQTFGVAGAGVIGAGWAARASASGLHVLAWDPDLEVGQWFRETVDNVWPVMEKIGLHPDASLDRLRIAESLETMVASADFIQENAPERLELKTELHRRIDQAVGDCIQHVRLVTERVPVTLSISRAGTGWSPFKPSLFAPAGGGCGG